MDPRGLVRQMRPQAPRSDVADESFGDPEHLRGFQVGKWSGTDCSHLIWRELGAPMPFAFGLPVLGDFITHVVGLSAREQMARIDAKPVVAAMTEKTTGGNRTVRLCPEEAVHQPEAPIHFDLSVTSGVGWLCPDMATSGAIYTGIGSDPLFNGDRQEAAIYGALWHPQFYQKANHYGN